jgi:hypothetical protein
VIFIVAVIIAGSLEYSPASSSNKPVSTPVGKTLHLGMTFVSAQQLTDIYNESFTEVSGNGSSQLSGTGLVDVGTRLFVSPPADSVTISIGQYNSTSSAGGEYSALFSNTGILSNGNYGGLDYKILGFGVFDMAVLTGGNYTVTIEFAYGAMGSNEVGVIQAQT